MKISAQQIKQFQKEILTWYKKNKRDLPWRDVPLMASHSGTSLQGTSFRDPYKILVSEVMAQQTQLSRVVPKYLEWMQAFPTVEELAKATTRDVLMHWSGLGYNRRGLYLKKCAEEIDKNGWPRTEKELRKLPGIGEYTARALLCFAFNEQVAVVDTNVRKVMMVKFKASNVKEVEEIAQQLLPKGKAYEWNQALMDYAAAELKHHKIPIPKQSTFKDSDRYFRGLIIRILLKKNKQSFKDLFATVLQDKHIEEERYKRILVQLEKDNLLAKKGKFFMLHEEL